MTSEKSLFDPRVEAAADARAERDVLEGRLISHSAVKRWIESWGTANAFRDRALAIDLEFGALSRLPP